MSQSRSAQVVVLGLGAVGRALVGQVLRHRKLHADRLNARFEIVAMLDSSGAVFMPNADKNALVGFPDNLTEKLLEYKAAGNKLGKHENGQEVESVDFIKQWAKPGCIVVDCSAAETSELVALACSQGAGVATANKKPLTGSLGTWRVMSSKQNRPRLKYESSCGAGTPMVASLLRLVNSGDEVRMIQGALSGTLGYLVSGLEAGKPYSEVVKQAYELGYTEPEPRDDLSGTDVARKALILARSIGLELEMKDVVPEPLYPEHLASMPVPEFLSSLKPLDAEFDAKIKQATSEGKVLRYVATVVDGKATVGLKAVPKESPIGRLQGTGNMVEIYTEIYADSPMVVQGSGAGGEVTAAGVLADMVELVTRDE